MGRCGGVRLLVLIAYVGISVKTHASQCDFSRLLPELKPYAMAFKASEKLSLGEQIPAKSSLAEEFIFRLKTRNWEAFSWELRPLELYAIKLAHEKYLELCVTTTDTPSNTHSNLKSVSILDGILVDFKIQKFSEEATKKFLRMFLLYAPCSSESDTKKLQELLNSEFHKNTEMLIDLIITTESEVPLFKNDFDGCRSIAGTKAKKQNFLVSDFFLQGMDAYKKTYGVEKNLILRLRRIRPSKLHFETGKYLFKNLDDFFQ